MKYRRKRFKERTRMPHMERLLSEKEFARAPLRCETTRFTIRRKEIHEEEETEKTLLRSIPRVYFRYLLFLFFVQMIQELILLKSRWIK